MHIYIHIMYDIFIYYLLFAINCLVVTNYCLPSLISFLLFTVCSLLSAIYYLLVAIHHLLVTVSCLLYMLYYVLIINYDLLCGIYCLRFITQWSLFVIWYLLLAMWHELCTNNSPGLGPERVGSLAVGKKKKKKNKTKENNTTKNKAITQPKKETTKNHKQKHKRNEHFFTTNIDIEPQLLQLLLLLLLLLFLVQTRAREGGCPGASWPVNSCWFDFSRTPFFEAFFGTSFFTQRSHSLTKMMAKWAHAGLFREPFLRKKCKTWKVCLDCIYVDGLHMSPSPRALSAPQKLRKKSDVCQVHTFLHQKHENAWKICSVKTDPTEPATFTMCRIYHTDLMFLFFFASLFLKKCECQKWRN